VIALWDEVFGYPEPRNAPAGVIAEALRHDPHALLIAVRDDALVGTIMAGYDGHRGWLYRLAVAPSARRTGIGSRLTQAALERLRLLGCKKVNLQLHTSNEDARLFWRAAGFADEPRISMGRDLTDAAPTLKDAGC
jgi:ribosomal protein S18 acetylase RimI-like enzyme